MFRQALKISIGLVGGVCTLQGQALASPSSIWSQQIIDCGADDTAKPITVYISETPRIYSQTLFLRHPGTFTLTASAQGFTFEGHAYLRNTLTRKWGLVAKSPPGRKTWVRTWRVTSLEGMSEVQMRMIKDDNSCKNCVITMNVSAKCL